MKDLEARAKIISEQLVYSYVQARLYGDSNRLYDLSRDALLKLASEVSAETERRVREEVIRECAELSRRLEYSCCGLCAEEILFLLPATPHQMKCQDCGKIDVLFTEKTKLHPCGPLCVECVMKRMNELRASQETPAEENK